MHQSHTSIDLHRPYLVFMENCQRRLGIPVVVAKIAEKHKATIGQVLIAWSVSRDIAVIPKSVHQERIIQNLQAKDVQLDSQDMEDLKNIGIKHRYVDGSFFTPTYSPYKLSDLWDN